MAYDPFSDAESVCAEIIDLILDEAGRMLYESYVQRLSFPFAARAAEQILMSELRMCFVRHDPGEVPNVGCSPPPPPPQVLSMQSSGASGESCAEREPLAEPSSPMHTEILSSTISMGPSASTPSAPSAPTDGWSLEAEPPRCKIDTWARSVVPIRRKLVTPKSAATAVDPRQGATRMTMKSKPASTTGSTRSLARPTNLNADDVAGRSGGMMQTPRQNFIPITDEREEDEEEVAMREMKDRETRRKFEEEARVQRRVVEEAEDAARLSQVQDQMKNKPFAYDSAGNVIWVQPLQVNKLPLPVPVPLFTCRKEVRDPGLDGQNVTQEPKRKPHIPQKRAKEKEFPDSFRSFSSQQPSMLEVMCVVPGVELAERGKTKKGKEGSESKRKPGEPMSRKDYEAMCEQGGYPPHPADAALDFLGHAESMIPAAAEASEPIPHHVSRDMPRDGSRSNTKEIGPIIPKQIDGRSDAAGKFKVVRGPDAGSQLLVQPPATPRPVQPVPPPLFRKQLKREALGFGTGTRERAQTGTGSRFPGCAPKPPLGATMGHGLVPSSQEYFYPGATSQIEPARYIDEASLGPVYVSPRLQHGQIVSKNPELAKRLFDVR